MNKQQKRRWVVVVTGASAGVGRATVREFAQRGAHIGLTARGPDGLEGAKRDVEAAGGEAVIAVADVADSAQVEAAVAAIEREFGPLDVWVTTRWPRSSRTLMVTPQGMRWC